MIVTVVRGQPSLPPPIEKVVLELTPDEATLLYKLSYFAQTIPEALRTLDQTTRPLWLDTNFVSEAGNILQMLNVAFSFHGIKQ